MKRDNLIYLDNAATTHPSDEVVVLFNKIENEIFGNPNSIHHVGIEANSYLNKARESILKSFNCSNHRVIFTASSTEANNLAIKGYCLKYQNRGKHIITTNVEHPSVLECFYQLRDNFGFDLTILNVDKRGLIRLDDLKFAMRNSTILVSIMAVNNEIGAINPIKDIAAIVHKYPKAVLHVDTTQAIGKLDLPYDQIDMFVASGHKLHGIKGSGCLVARKNISFLPLISGGGQEEGFRSGTQSVSLACSLAKAISLSLKGIREKNIKANQLNALLRSEVSKNDGIVLNSNEYCTPYIFNFSLGEKKAAVVVEALSNKGIAVSSVSACHSKREASSYVAAAIGRNEKLSANTIRVSLSEDTTEEEILAFSSALKEILENIK